MMTPAVAGALGRHFRASAASDFAEALLRHKLDEQRRQQREDDINHNEAESYEFAVAMISAADVVEFRVELDTYDTATVEDLQVNERELIEARENVSKMLARAHVLPDGRRVFETEDGVRVFDEKGNELDASVITPGEIDDSHPKWEDYARARQRVDGLEQQRTDILDYQAKLDDARERLDAGDMTRDEFERLRADLKAEMPEAVRDQIPELADQKPEAKAEVPQAADRLDITDDMLPAAPAGKAAALTLGG